MWQRYLHRTSTFLILFLLGTAPPAFGGPREPLLDSLGDHSYKVTTDSALAQRYFDQGLRWAYAFNHAAARRSFQEAQRHDPNCAMCYWGEAYVLGPNINAPMEEEANGPALAAVKKARQAAGDENEHEKALIEAMAMRYSSEPGKDRSELDAAYAQAMEKVHQRFPRDNEIAVLYADAVMNTTPWDYWEADGKTPKGKIGEVITVVEQTLVRNPNHVGAIHFYIHLTEASTTPARAEPYAERLAALMPGAGHIVHMGSHTFQRIGDFRKSMDVNKKAVEADEVYFAMLEIEDDSLWRYGYHPHNIHYVASAALMAGQVDTALEYAHRLEGTIPDNVAADIGWIQAIRQAPYFIHAHLSDPETILALKDPGEQFPFVKGAWHYARGVAFARKGEIEKGEAEATRIGDIAKRRDLDYPADIAYVVPEVLRIAQHVVRGRLAQAQDNPQRAVNEFRAAVEIQDGLPYTEPPFWYYPVRQSLGAALIQAGEPVRAEQVFRLSLEKMPNNGWSLYGLMEAELAQGDDKAAAATKPLLERAWSGDLDDLSLSRL